MHIGFAGLSIGSNPHDYLLLIDRLIDKCIRQYCLFCNNLVLYCHGYLNIHFLLSSQLLILHWLDIFILFHFPGILYYLFSFVLIGIIPWS